MCPNRDTHSTLFSETHCSFHRLDCNKSCCYCRAVYPKYRKDFKAFVVSLAKNNTLGSTVEARPELASYEFKNTPRILNKNDPNPRFTFSQHEIEKIMWLLGELMKKTDYHVADKLVHARAAAEKYMIQCRIDVAREAGEWK